MITTEELEVWKSKITGTMTQSLTSAKQSRGAEKAYFRNIAKVADAQLSIVQRLIVQSKENDARRPMPKYKIGDIVYVNMTSTQKCLVIGIRERGLTGELVYDLEILSHWFPEGTRVCASEKLVYATREDALEKALCQK